MWPPRFGVAVVLLGSIDQVAHQIVPVRAGIDQFFAQVGVEDFLANIGAVGPALGGGADLLVSIVDSLETDAAALFPEEDGGVGRGGTVVGHIVKMTGIVAVDSGVIVKGIAVSAKEGGALDQNQR